MRANWRGPRDLSIIYPYDLRLTVAAGIGAGLLIAGVAAAGGVVWGRRPYVLRGGCGFWARWFR